MKKIMTQLPHTLLALSLAFAGTAIAEPHPEVLNADMTINSDTRMSPDMKATTRMSPDMKATVEGFVNKQDQLLGQRTLIASLIERNAQALFSQMQTSVATDEIQRQRAYYQPEWFSELRYSDQRTENSASDRLTSVQRLNQDVFKETLVNVETGVRVPVNTGAELVVSWKGDRRKNNLISTLTDPTTGDQGEDTEYVGSLNIGIRQPLLRGLGSRAVEDKIRESELSLDVAEQQFRQQLLGLSSEALSAYWQLYRLNRFVGILSVALKNAEQTHQETARLVDVGKLPQTALLESESTILQRRSEHEASRQAWLDRQSELKTLLNLPDSAFTELTFIPVDEPQTQALPAPADFNTYADSLLRQWPGYLIAERSLEIENLRLNIAREESKPKLDLALGYSTSSLSSNSGDPVTKAFDTDYPTWYVGLEYSMPLGKNVRGNADQRTAKTRISQAQLNMHAVRVSMNNELRGRLQQLAQSHQELGYSDRAQALQLKLYQAERDKFRSGQVRLKDLYDREYDWIRAQQRYVDSLVRYQLAIVTLKLAEGTLFADFGINIGLAASTTPGE